ncbi:hypothetical protein SDC9_185146 [bioreactor metagenome]|uniref:Uncharacterized protein n=1 Tax=bioreactor metagenome TaxID=1076179 RepID=A0A645HGC8_9ZZZZ
MFLKQVMRLDQNQRCRGLKSYPAFDADDGIPYMHIPANPVTGTSLVQFFYYLHRRELFAIQ